MPVEAHGANSIGPPNYRFADTNNYANPNPGDGQITQRFEGNRLCKPCEKNQPPSKTSCQLESTVQIARLFSQVYSIYFKGGRRKPYSRVGTINY